MAGRGMIGGVGAQRLATTRVLVFPRMRASQVPIPNPFPEPPVPEIDAAGLMVPPWVKYPSIPRASIGWRMGEGEGYWDDFRAWWERQPTVVQAQVRVAYPEPAGWSGFYDRV